MTQKDKTKEELNDEIKLLQKRIAELETADTERKRVEEALQKTKQQMEFILGVTKTGLDIIDSEFNMVYIDSEWQKVYGEYKGKKCYEYFMGRNATCPNCGIPKALKTKKPLVSEEALPKEGNRLIQVTTIPFQDEKGNWLVAEVNVDITERKKIEEVLRIEKEFDDNLIRTAQTIILVLDLKGRIVSFNPYMEKISGYRFEEVKGKDWFETFLPKEIQKKTRELFSKAISDIQTKGNVNAIITKDGRKLQIEWYDKTFKDDKGKIAGLLCVGQDITERKRAEEAVKKSEEYFRAITENILDIIINVDKKGVINYITPSIECVAGYKPEEIVGKSAFDFIHPADLPRAAVDFAKALITKETNIPNSFRVRHKDGSERILEGLGKNLFDNPAVAGFVMNVRDITERKKAEEELRLSEDKFAKAFNASPSAVFITTLKEGRFIEINKTGLDIFGYKPDEIVGRTVKELGLWGDLNDRATLLGRLQKEGIVRNMEASFRRKSGEVFPAIISVDTVDIAGQQFLLSTCTDITERKKAEEELRVAYKKLEHTQQELIQSSKMAAMGQLAAGISHELNQPLTGIKGFAQAVLMKLEKESPFRNDLNKIVVQADRIDEIIKDVRFFARKSDFKIVELDINQVTSDSLMLLSQQLKVHNIKVIQELGLGIPKIKGDPNQLQQAFINIINNARDAILSLNRPEGGEIRIRTSLSQDKNHVEINFQDTGCGIPEGSLQHIFSPFFTTKSPGGGMGLGLSITYRIIENHQGKIEFQSKAGEGTIFRIVLPLKKKS